MSEDERHEFPHWEELYQQQEIESMPWFNPELDEDLDNALNELRLRGGSALDLGTGPGTQAIELARRGFAVTATDISEAAIRLAREKAQKQGLEITWELDDILDTRLDRQLDLIFDRLEYSKMDSFDVIIVGAGISGIGAAVHLRLHCPGKTFAVLEGRDAIGGTWDLFRYPGVRSDSDMHTLGYNFKPWKHPKAIADGSTIRAYVQEAAEEYGIVPHIRFKHLVHRLSWSSADALWTVEADHNGRAVSFTARYVMLCAGYYRYSTGYTPEFAGVSRFKGALIHPQFWPEDLDYAGKRVIVIGSGATAVTLVPAMAEKAAHVTMVQRSPTYMLSLPAVDVIANWLRKHLPLNLAYRLTRWRNVVLQLIFFKATRTFPDQSRKRLLKLIREQLGPEYDLAHFTPRYNPWDERLCVVPDNDLFAAIKAGKVSIVTDHIDTFTDAGLKLRTGRELEADIIITATGLELQFAAGAEVRVDERPIEIGKAVLYKGIMFSGVPNLASVFGYTNASWTLRADLLAEYFCRLINFMDAHAYVEARPKEPDPTMPVKPLGNLKSGYFKRAEERLPREGMKGPWRNPQNYAFDIFRFRFGAIEDGILEFRRACDSSVPETSPVSLADAPIKLDRFR